MYMARIGSTAPFIVIDTLMRSSGMPSNRIFMSSTESIATPAFADIADHARMIGVIAAMGRQIEGDRQPGLSGGEILPIEGVGVLRG